MFFYLLLSILAAILAVPLSKWYRQRRQVALSKIPLTPNGRFLMGNTAGAGKIFARKSEHHFSVHIMDIIRGYGVMNEKNGIQILRIGPHHVFVSVEKPEAVELLLSSSSAIKKADQYSFLHKWLGQGLLTSSGSKWKSRRKLLTPCFHFRILEDFVPIFNEQSLVLIEKIKARVEEDFVDTLPLILLCTLDVVCETMMGVRIGAQGGSNSDYVKAIDSMNNHFFHRLARPWVWADFIFYNLTSQGRRIKRHIKTLHDFTNKVIQDRKREMIKHRSKSNEGDEKKEVDEGSGIRRRRAFLDLLLDLHLNGEQLSEQDIREEVDTFMFEGHDTTALSISYALYCIGLYPEVQNKIMEELNSIFSGDMERATTLEDVRDMKYLECTIKEALRLYPSVPVIGRKIEEDIHYEGATIPKGFTVGCVIFVLHRRPDIYPEPEVFDPDRFLPENVLNRHPFAYVPFSAGSRNCIGQKFAMIEEKIIISNILRRFQVVSLDPRDKVQVRLEITLKPDTPIRLKFIPR